MSETAIWIGLWVLMAWAVIRESRKDKPTKPAPGTLEDPAVALMVVKQRAFGKRLRRKGLSILSGKDYDPVLTKKADAPEPARQLYAIRGGKQ